jgi:hypothetical protein
VTCAEACVDTTIAAAAANTRMMDLLVSILVVLFV